ncbi:2-dehydro-3-deoxygalactonokinase [uncultured Fusobacterium sp.]|uniref:2-dehydro-3-deoxygalactonokinase n=1 Tax=uncultured Fusobacterium sp. TaxID=159267 RepID=UPI0025E83F9E|nr:2-dehydro-3-deoxygalactonokinase [uncultured Fusobacterium sp.]
MKKIITIDAGTSNLRIRIVEENKIIFERKENYGVKIGKENFQNNLYKVLKEVIEKNKLKKEEIECILASGMITSSLGLMEIEHLHIPVSVTKLAQNIKKIRFFEFEINLITGVKVEKNYFEKEKLKSIDVIRGEEVEVFGILEELNSKESLLIILPGSHNKFIEVSNGAITNLLTTMSGEIYDVMTKNTILKASLKENFAKKIEKKFLKLGNDIGRKYGINQGSFILRGLDLVESLTIDEKANFLLGLVLSGDIATLERNNYLKRYRKIVIAGGNIIAKGLYELLIDLQLENELSLVISNELATRGALKILRENKGGKEE